MSTSLYLVWCLRHDSGLDSNTTESIIFRLSRFILALVEENGLSFLDLMIPKQCKAVARFPQFVAECYRGEGLEFRARQVALLRSQGFSDEKIEAVWKSNNRAQEALDWHWGQFL